MTIYNYHPDDFTAGAPLVLPAPLISGAVFLSGSYPCTADDETFLIRNSISVEELGNIWMVFVWDTEDECGIVAQAAFTWTDGEVALLALDVAPVHPSLPLREFLLQTGAGLFGGRPIVDRTTTARSPLQDASRLGVGINYASDPSKLH